MKFFVRSNDFKSATVNCDVKACSPSDRFLLGFKKLALFWGAATASVFIPVAHFILVPTFLITGAFFFYREARTTHLLKNVGFSCPNCSNANEYKKDFTFLSDVRCYCQKCSAQLVLSRDDI